MAALFLLQRGLAAGITIYAPAIVLSTVFGWRLDVTIVLSGLLVIIYTVTGGSQTVTLTQKYQLALIFGGMMPVGGLESGFLAHAVGVPWTISIGALLCAGAGLVTWWVVRRDPAASGAPQA